MKKYIPITVICLFGAVGTQAQAIIERQLVASAGINATLGNVIIQSTVGEAVILTLQNPRTVLTQGFQQPEVTTANVPNLEPLIVDFFVAPNPASDQVQLRFDLLKDAQVNILLVNNAGQVVSNEIVDMLAGNITRIMPISQYAAGMYYVVLKVRYRTFTAKLVVQ